MAKPARFPFSARRAIRQVAALPYRTDGAGPDAPVRVMLVTSRQSRRWVVPKGNTEPGLTLHAAAAAEAEEEAGVLGTTCPTAIGRYRYRKTRGSGAALMVDVDVFPLAVTHELDHWQEQHQRERRWFTLAEAAQAVNEPDLKDLIRSFGSGDFRAAARRSATIPAADSPRTRSMFAWFQRLLPRTGNFFGLFEEHSRTICAAADALARLMQGGGNGAEHIREVAEREHDADTVTREVLVTVRRTFLTPFDRSAITRLIGAMDDTVDEMHAAASAIDLYQLREFAPEMRDMAGIVVEAARVASEAIPLLRDVARNGDRLHELTERLIRLEGQADDIHAAGLRRSLADHGAGDTLRFVVEREIYKHLERITDAFEDVADEIDGIVIDHA